MLPSGEGKGGWKAFHTLINNYPFADKPQKLPLPNQDISSPAPRQPYPITSELPQSPVHTTHTMSSLIRLTLFQETFAWSRWIIVQCHSFHDDWHSILRSIPELISEFCSLSPVHAHKALLRCEDGQQAKSLTSVDDWQPIGPCKLRFLPWSTNNMNSNRQVPSYGGWITIRDLPLCLHSHPIHWEQMWSFYRSIKDFIQP